MKLSHYAEDIEVVVGTIDAGATFTYTFEIVGLEVGTQELVAGLDSQQVELVAGETEIIVDEGSEETDSPTVPEAVKVTSVDRNIDINRRVRRLTWWQGDISSLLLYHSLPRFIPCRSTTQRHMTRKIWC